MEIRGFPPADVAIDAALVRGLLRDQHADLADLPLVDGGHGWDNRMYRLGDDFAVRLPRRAIAAPLIEHEQRWLPELAPRLPLTVPTPRRIGRPGRGYPWSWSVVSWLPGAPAAATPLSDIDSTIRRLAAFLHALHRPAPRDAPANPFRGGVLADRTPAVHERARAVDEALDRDAVVAAWQAAVDAPRWSGPPIWIHGDLHPGNLLVHQGQLSGVIDFGDLTAGDPATDLSIAWMLFSASERRVFRSAVAGAHQALDAFAWQRASGWALAFGLVFLTSSGLSPVLNRLGFTTIEAVLSDGPRQTRDG